MNALASQTLKSSQIGDFRRDGFVVLDSVLGSALLSRLRSNLDNLLIRAVAEAEDNRDFSLERAEGAKAVRKINNFIRYGDVWWELISHPVVLGPVRDLIGDDIRLHHTKLMVKPPHEGSAKEWHQDLDSYVAREERPRLIAKGRSLTPNAAPLIAAQIYLDDSTEQNGCLQFIPGSHHWGVLDRSNLSRDEPMPGARVVDAPASAGSVAIFHCMILHYSAPNLSSHARRGPIVQFMPPPDAIGVPLNDVTERTEGHGHKF